MDGIVDGFVFSDEIRNSDYRVTVSLAKCLNKLIV